MALAWNEIKKRAIRFSKDWETEDSERAESQTFWNEFFDVFGVKRKQVASFEHKVEIPGQKGRIDLLWKGRLLVEQKSRGRNLDDAAEQAKTYAQGLPAADVPDYILVSDFENFRLWDLEKNERHAFVLKDLHKNVRSFGFLAGYKTHVYKEEDPVNIAAAVRMGALHDALKDGGYDGHPLEVLLVRLLFCLFADDTGIFEDRQFQDLIENRTSPDGADLGQWLTQLFQVLNTSKEKRQKALDEQLAEFEYVNGRLFEEMLPMPSFDSAMRKALLQAADLDWSRISPAIFGSLFQSIMSVKDRRNLGAHYTSEKNILKLIGPLFMDDLRAELEKVKDNLLKLKTFHIKLANLRFLDPACGCGNFLVVAYRELRLLELDLLKAQFAKQDALFSGVAEHVNVDVDQFYGIEIEEFPAQIAQVAMWLMDHQMNLRVSENFGEYFVRLPLKKTATIVHGNALRTDWGSVCSKDRLSYILGNPPFVGSKMMSDEQSSDMTVVAPKLQGIGVLDFVSAWYLKAADLVQETGIRCAFVSTNSITQGEQVGVLWGHLLAKGMKIHFAHRTFAWSSEAKGRAAVHCVIIGFGPSDIPNKRIWDYEHIKSEPVSTAARNINPYLIDGPDLIVEGRLSPICHVQPIVNGSIPADGGHLLMTAEERDQLLSKEPGARQWIKPYLGAEGFLHNEVRWCLWLVNCQPEQLKALPLVLDRVAAVRKMRSESAKAATREKANIPMLFTENRQPISGHYLAIPRTSSETRRYIPIGYLEHDVIAANDLQMVPNASAYNFGVITSAMHMAWVGVTSGRLESRIRYSVKFTYNSYPWPESPSDKQKTAVEQAAQEILDVRAKFPTSTLADLYDPIAMPPELYKAHQRLDKAVDAAYGKTTFKSDADRVAYLFGLYQKYTSLLPSEKAGKKRK